MKDLVWTEITQPEDRKALYRKTLGKRYLLVDQIFKWILILGFLWYVTYILVDCIKSETSEQLASDIIILILMTGMGIGLIWSVQREISRGDKYAVWLSEPTELTAAIIDKLTELDLSKITNARIFGDYRDKAWVYPGNFAVGDRVQIVWLVYLHHGGSLFPSVFPGHPIPDNRVYFINPFP